MAKPLSKTMKVFIGLTVLGLIASWYVILTTISGEIPRPDRVMDQELAEIADLSVLVSRENHVIYDRYFGEGTEHPKYALGELEELFVGLAVCILHDQERIDLDGWLGNYLQGLPSNVASLPLLSLLTHTSGIPAGATRTPDRGVELKPGVASAFAPINTRLLRDMVEHLTGLPFQDFVMEKMLEPLELKNITWDASANNGNGDWLVAPEDMRFFLQELNSNRLIRLKTHLRAFTLPVLENGERGEYAFGWRPFNNRGLRLERMTTRGEGYSLTLIRYPEKDLEALMFYKGDGAFDTDAFAERLGVIYLEREMPFNGRLDKVMNRDEKIN